MGINSTDIGVLQLLQIARLKNPSVSAAIDQVNHLWRYSLEKNVDDLQGHKPRSDYFRYKEVRLLSTWRYTKCQNRVRCPTPYLRRRTIHWV